ncbi:class F sortase [Promicromonospora sp. NPDC090134]|uniref:class F sortase n=1 Tax=Promicromonospora sp. NPDC090134 TaxID=3364408 RepID=UPI00382D1C02
MTPPRKGAVARAARTGSACAAVACLMLVIAGCTGTPGPSAPEAAPAPSAVASRLPPDGGRDVASGTDRAPQQGTADGTLGEVPVRAAQDTPTPRPPAPVQVEVPALDVDVSVRPEGVDAQGRMALPASADQAAWYRFGSAPASASGATVVAAHVDDEESVGPFARLALARSGSAVRVRTADGTTHNYTVTDVRAEAKADVSFDDLFDRSGRPRLVLVTCGGEWDADAGSYSDNIVVTAEPRS